MATQAAAFQRGVDRRRAQFVGDFYPGGVGLAPAWEALVAGQWKSEVTKLDGGTRMEPAQRLGPLNLIAPMCSRGISDYGLMIPVRWKRTGCACDLHSSNSAVEHVVQVPPNILGIEPSGTTTSHTSTEVRSEEH